MFPGTWIKEESAYLKVEGSTDFKAAEVGRLACLYAAQVRQLAGGPAPTNVELTGGTAPANQLRLSSAEVGRPSPSADSGRVTLPRAMYLLSLRFLPAARYSAYIEPPPHFSVARARIPFVEDEWQHRALLQY